jgi:hypothetical protein
MAVPAPPFRRRPAPARLLVLVLIGTLAVLSGLVTMVQVGLLLYARDGAWQAPAIYRATIVEVDRTSANPFTCEVDALVGGEVLTLAFPRDEARELRAHDAVWVLDNYYATAIRAGQYRLTPQRLFVEFPLLPLALALLLLARLRRSRWGLPPELPPGERIVFRDTCHLKALRHARGYVPPRPGEDG